MAFFDLPLDQLEQYRPDIARPADFDEFWDRTLAEHALDPQAVSLRPVDAGLAELVVQDLSFPGFGGDAIAGWVISPPGPGPRPAVVEFMGYGGGRGLPEEHLHWASAGFVHIVMDTRGQGGTWGSGGATPDPGPAGGPAAPGVMTRGIQDPDDYYYRRLYVDAHNAVEAAAGLPGVAADRIAVAGISQGGGLAIAAASLNPRVWATLADVPFLCHFERAVGLTDAHPYAEVVGFLGVNRDLVATVFRTLSYFDNVNLAQRATAPALFSTALMDQVCPPSTVFAMKNHYGGPSEIEVYPFNGHEGGEGCQARRRVQWLQEFAARGA